MSRCYNFCAGPAALPEAVLETARDEMLEKSRIERRVYQTVRRRADSAGSRSHGAPSAPRISR